MEKIKTESELFMAIESAIIKFSLDNETPINIIDTYIDGTSFLNMPEQKKESLSNIVTKLALVPELIRAYGIELIQKLGNKPAFLNWAVSCYHDLKVNELPDFDSIRLDASIPTDPKI